jgi:hypothetical protein
MMQKEDAKGLAKSQGTTPRHSNHASQAKPRKHFIRTVNMT